MDKILSIIVPSYNMEAFLDRSLSSLIVGTPLMERLEVLVVNDGSKDRTSEIAHGYESRFPGTFRVIDKANGHYGSCVNAGLAQASGKYVKVLDADDYFGERFADYLAFLTTVDADLILTDNVVVDEAGVITDRRSFNLPKDKVISLAEMMPESSHLNHFNITHRTSILKDNGYRQTEGISYTDLEWTTVPLGYIKSFVYCPFTVYHYLRGRDGQSVDIAYRRKNMWMENKVVLGLSGMYESVKESIAKENAGLLKVCVSSLIRQVYFHYLINYPRYLDEKELVGFDKALHESSPELYESVSDTKDVRRIGTFRYISDFRRNGTRKSIKYFYFDACTAIGSIFRELRRK